MSFLWLFNKSGPIKELSLTKLSLIQVSFSILLTLWRKSYWGGALAQERQKAVLALWIGGQEETSATSFQGCWIQCRLPGKEKGLSQLPVNDGRPIGALGCDFKELVLPAFLATFYPYSILSRTRMQIRRSWRPCYCNDFSNVFHYLKSITCNNNNNKKILLNDLFI